jgi:putative cardiolipin synthase
MSAFHKIWIYLFIISCFTSISAKSQIIDEKIHFLNSCEEALKARLWLIQQAQKEILISYYIFQDDDIGIFFLNEIIKIKQKKPELKINIIQDAFNNGLSKNIKYYLEQSGIQFKEFHPLPKIFLPTSLINTDNFLIAMKNFNYRMHDKLLIVDGEYIITGGRNMDEGYFGLSSPNFYDKEILFHSHIAGKLTAEYFNWLWSSSNVSNFSSTIDYSKYKDYAKTLHSFHNIENHLNEIHNFDFLNNQNFGFVPRWIKVETIELLHSYSEDKKTFDPQVLTQNFLNLILSAEHEIIIESPYLLLTENFLETIALCRSKNISVIFITNSYCTNDLMHVAGAYDVRKSQLLKLGAEIYEYTGPGYLHAKCFMIDRKIALLGSYNLDPRSANINTETVFSFTGEQAMDTVMYLFEKDLKLCNKLSLVDGDIEGVYMNCNRSFWDKFLYVFIQSLSQIKWVYDLL